MESARGPYYKNHRVDIHVFNQLTSQLQGRKYHSTPCLALIGSKNNQTLYQQRPNPPDHRTPATVVYIRFSLPIFRKQQYSLRRLYGWAVLGSRYVRPVERSPRASRYSPWSAEHAVSSCFDIFGSKPTEGAGCAVVGVYQRCEGLFYMGQRCVRSCKRGIKHFNKEHSDSSLSSPKYNSVSCE